MALIKNLVFTSEWQDIASGKPCKYRFKLYEHMGKSIVIASDFDDNAGFSVSDCIERLANRFCHTYKVDPKSLVVILVNRHGPDKYARVEMAWDGKRLSDPARTPITTEEIERLIDEPF